MYPQVCTLAEGVCVAVLTYRGGRRVITKILREVRVRACTIGGKYPHPTELEPIPLHDVPPVMFHMCRQLLTQVSSIRLEAEMTGDREGRRLRTKDR